jgi:hypothetical protein
MTEKVDQYGPSDDNLDAKARGRSEVLSISAQATRSASTAKVLQLAVQDLVFFQRMKNTIGTVGLFSRRRAATARSKPGSLGARLCRM